MLIAILPLAAIAASYSLAAGFERVPLCNPFIDGCTSISATGRYAPASYVFKPAHLVVAALLLVFWTRLARNRLHGPRRAGFVRVSGYLAACALVIYTLTLGSQTPLYEFMRRFGIYLFFIGTVLAQVVATIDLRASPVPVPLPARRTLALMLASSFSPVVLGSLNFLLKATLENADPIENRIEWTTVVLMQAWFYFYYRYSLATELSPAAQTSAGRS